MIYRVFWAAILCALLAACQTELNGLTTTDVQNAAIAHERVSFKGERATKAERQLCQAAGGEVRRAGLLGYENCILPYADAGKTCSDSSDCIGDCRLTSSGAAPEETVTGTCQINDSLFGCFQTVENGRAGHMLCVD